LFGAPEVAQVEPEKVELVETSCETDWDCPSGRCSLYGTCL
jgi:hypothetical protein